MRLQIGILLVSILLHYSCKEKRSESLEQSESQLKNQPIYNDNPIIKKFNLTCNSELQIDTNILVFYWIKRFDTTFLLRMRNDSDKVRGLYYEVLPNYHSDLEGYTEGGINFVFFDGFSFEMDRSMWDKIKQNASTVAQKDRARKPKLCLDCSSFFLMYNNQPIYDNPGNQDDFNQLRKYLKSTIVDRINNVRKKFNGSSDTK